jgi:hypothetical protein
MQPLVETEAVTFTPASHEARRISVVAARRERSEHIFVHGDRAIDITFM